MHLVPATVIWASATGEWVWACRRFPSCDTYARCHSGTKIPMGALAGPALRRLRRIAHAAFDPLWNDPDGYTRDQAYLAASIDFNRLDLHISQLTTDECRRLPDRIDAIREMLDSIGSPERVAEISEIHIDILEASFNGIHSVGRSTLDGAISLVADLFLAGYINPTGNTYQLTASGQRALSAALTEGTKQC